MNEQGSKSSWFGLCLVLGAGNIRQAGTHTSNNSRVKGLKQDIRNEASAMSEQRLLIGSLSTSSTGVGMEKNS